MNSEKKVRVIVCEGPDDLGVLRVMVNDALSALGINGKVVGQKWDRRSGLFVDKPKLRLELVAAEGAKSDLARRVLDKAEGSASLRPDMVGVVFDPDRDAAEQEFNFFITDFNQIAVGERKGGKLRESGDDHITTIRNRDVTILHAGWRTTPAPNFDDLTDEQDLERLLIGGILESMDASEKELMDWATESTTALCRLHRDHGWKRAFRIWNAVLQPKAESFADKLLQNSRTKTGCKAILNSTPVKAMLDRMLDFLVDTEPTE